MAATGRTLTYLRKLGYHVDKVEQYVAQVEGKDQAAKFTGGYRRDAFGFMDVLAFCSGGSPQLLAVQCTTRKQIAKHLRDYRRDPKIRQRILDWLACDFVFAVHGWERVKLPCKTNDRFKARWQLNERYITRADLELTEKDRAAIAAAERAERKELTP